jgi:hypothetical protein
MSSIRLCPVSQYITLQCSAGARGNEGPAGALLSIDVPVIYRLTSKPPNVVCTRKQSRRSIYSV